ncbi:major capsid protein [Mycobacterium sp. 23]|uniref:major capsid protein n=1 Tax=Mycobacterium sp. 23 TaxID=3400424 RepID=UPI003AAFC552
MPTFEYPLGNPTVSGTTISVDTMLNEPTRITRYLSDLTLRGYWADKVFTPGGGVSGGAILYTQLTQNELFVASGRDVQNVEPGAEFPLVTFDRPTPLVKPVEKFGGKFFVTDEARDRNDPLMLQQGAQRLANTINRRIHTNAVAEIDAQITALGGSAQTATGNDWSAVVTGGSSQTNATGWPAADFAKVQLLADQKELGVQFDTWILNPVNANEFKIAYGNEWRAVLEDNGIMFVVTNRVTAGTAYVIESGQVGQMRLEKPLGTETWREQATQRTWVQSDVRPVFVITNPYGIAKVTGL